MSERELYLILLEDIEVLLANKPPRPNEIRQTFGPIIRRWVVEQNFKRTQKVLMPHIVRFKYWGNQGYKENLKNKVYSEWVGLIEFNGIGIAVEQPNLGHDLLPSTKNYEIHEPWSAFFKQKVCLIDGTIYSRHDVCKFHANELGGAHFDPGVSANRDSVRLRQTLGYEVDVNLNIKMLMGEQITAAKNDPSRRSNVYDLADLILADTARVFAESVQDALPFLEQVIAET